MSPATAAARQPVAVADREAPLLGAPEHAQRQALWTDAIILVACVVAVTLAVLLRPTPDLDGLTLFGNRLPEACGFERLGAKCPGAGLTRSFVLGIRADPRAVSMHPGGVLLLLLAIAQIPYRAWRIRSTRHLMREGLVDMAELERERVWSWVRRGFLSILFVVWLSHYLFATGAP